MTSMQCCFRCLLLWVATCRATGSFDVTSSHKQPRALAAQARTDFQSMRGPELEGRLSLSKSNFAVHLGGFCFGHTGDEDDREVAKVQASFVFEADQPFTATGNLYLAFFDARDDRWGKVSKSWETSSCADKLSLATYFDFSDILSAHNLDTAYTRVGKIMQHSDTRDWHGALIGCNVHPNVTTGNPAVRYEVVGMKGALSVFAADNFHPNSCPNGPIYWWKFAVADRSFWILIGGFIALYAIVFMFLFRQCRRQINAQSSTKQLSEDTANVTGYPFNSIKKDTDVDVAPLPVGKSCDSLDPLKTGTEKNVEIRSE